MPDKEPQFTVTDRRKFTLEGELRDGEAQKETSASPPEEVKNAPPSPRENVAGKPADDPQEKPDLDAAAAPEGETDDAIIEPTAEESAAQSRDYHASSRQLDEVLRQANAGASSVPMNFDRLVQSIYMTAAMQMGVGAAPGEQPRIDILGARQSIDMLGVLEEKTKGNLTDDERRLLQSALFDLRMSFLEITNAIAKQGQRPPKSGIAP